MTISNIISSIKMWCWNKNGIKNHLPFAQGMCSFGKKEA